ncbi:helix-turn-helix domain-containing protein [Aquimarina algiphila]|uniref:Helix-turn-helix transcriptional regulator n=1 Tax=Aquimarina algiphila TaxID=2047982 RepID=A0A554VDF3_9FLAO|nr:AraC family transcriptional regulator [Aquimarina algiphila]TSE04889.1 helix-turn-helix transcriptional regulator [Aquimarina algiphila]
MNEIYIQKDADPKVSIMIQSFWWIDKQGDLTIQREKIIPDGYPELIFHLGDAYKTNINGVWELQGKDLIAGQIKNSFFLENTGESKMFAIKMQPWALTELFDIEITSLTDKVVEIPLKSLKILKPIKEVATSSLSFDEKVKQIENWFLFCISKLKKKPLKGQKIVELIIRNNGKLSLKEIQNKIGISERSLERYFKAHIGLSPKFYVRIIRFSYIFRLIQEGDIDWSDIVFQAGFYDQSHFIKNFKEFTGEDPSQYKFFEENMANLFLKK